MIEYLKALDQTLFLIINGSHNLAMDMLFSTITNFGYFRIPVVILVLIGLVKGSSLYRKNLIMVVAVVLLADFISSQIMKNIFQRLRPCHVIENVRLLVGCSRSFSFPSSHAANICAFAAIGAYFYSKLKYFLLVIALAVCYSRVYTGVHYPFDCVFGAVLGVTVSLFSIKYLEPVIEKLPFFKKR